MNGAAPIDWAATGAMLQGLGSILQGVGSTAGATAIIVGAYIGASTYQKWRRQKLAERRIELAERILVAAYNVRRALSRLRSPAMLSNELEAAKQHLLEAAESSRTHEEPTNSLIYTQAYYDRLNNTLEERKVIQDIQPIARALFGEKLDDALGKLSGIFWTVRVYADSYSDRSGDDQAFRKEIESTIWEGYPSTEENKLDQLIAEQMRSIEGICLPVIRDEMAFADNGKFEKAAHSAD